MATTTATPAAAAQPAAAASQSGTDPKTQAGTEAAKGVSGETKSPAATSDAAKGSESAQPTTLLGKKLPPPDPGQAAAEASEKDGKAKAEDYQVELPKESLLGPDQAKAMTEQYRKLGLTKDQAQALAAQTDGMLKSYVDTQVAKLQETEAGWWKALEADPKYGGKNLTANDKLATAALDRFFPGLKDELMNSPYAAHPVLFKGLVELGRMIADAKFRVDGQATTGKVENPAHAMYGEDGMGKNVVKKGEVA